MRHICYSSEVYHLDPRDLAVLADSPKSCKADCADKVVILIGEKDIYDAQKPVIYDTLLKGRSLVEKAVADGRDFIPVRIAFISRTAAWDFVSPLIRVLRYKYKAYSSNIYHINPFEIRRLKIERSFRTPENAYQFSNPKYKMPESERKSSIGSWRTACAGTAMTTAFRWISCFVAIWAFRIPLIRGITGWAWLSTATFKGFR